MAVDGGELQERVPAYFVTNEFGERGVVRARRRRLAFEAGGVHPASSAAG